MKCNRTHGVVAIICSKYDPTGTNWGSPMTIGLEADKLLSHSFEFSFIISPYWTAIASQSGRDKAVGQVILYKWVLVYVLCLHWLHYVKRNGLPFVAREFVIVNLVLAALVPSRFPTTPKLAQINNNLSRCSEQQCKGAISWKVSLWVRVVYDQGH